MHILFYCTLLYYVLQVSNFFSFYKLKGCNKPELSDDQHFLAIKYSKLGYVHCFLCAIYYSSAIKHLMNYSISINYRSQSFHFDLLNFLSYLQIWSINYRGEKESSSSLFSLIASSYIFTILLSKYFPEDLDQFLTYYINRSCNFLEDFLVLYTYTKQLPLTEKQKQQKLFKFLLSLSVF